ncbi:choice-of-anchor L domain-containing protein [Salibacter halophilus]|uniref:OmpA family protein n=1 Tax=Salibacter halophilus TaxID=1803916 RepID=A0A6N6M8L5_9FLAO|nr:choice-of-anchor L domain-containing protein [Salibacter halophilus]KAB1064358.1 OmpA family protein [Salibacter halophilus]
MSKKFIIAVFLLSAFTVRAQLLIDEIKTLDHVINDVLIKGDLETRNLDYTRGARGSFKLFENENSILPIKRGVVLSTGSAGIIPMQNVETGASGSMGVPGDPDLDRVAKGVTFDATVLTFDFVPEQNTISFRYVFGSEEYPEYVNRGFNDVFVFYLIDLKTQERRNLAVIPNTDEPISIDNINSERYSQFYIDNTNFKPMSVAQKTIEFDGITRPLIAYAKVEPGRAYRIKIAIADAGDSRYDSAVFLEGGSFQSQDEDTFVMENRRYFEQFEKERLKIEGEEPLTQSEIEKQEIKVLEPESKDLTETKNEEVKTVEKAEKTQEKKNFEYAIYFGFDKNIPNENQIARFAEWLDKVPDDLNVKEVKIEGHTDNKGTKNYNQKLSYQRAMWVQNYLLDNDVEWEMAPKAFDFSKPASNNDSEEGRAKNRRVRIIFVQ